MIIACPSCATQQTLPDDVGDAGSVIHCSGCGHSWLEARAVEIVESVGGGTGADDAKPINLPAEISLPDTDHEAARIARAVQLAEEKRARETHIRRKAIARWSGLAVAVVVPFLLALAFPQSVVKALPGTIALYEKAGMKVNIRGLEISNVTRQYVLVGKTRVLAVKGLITNISGSAQTVPSMRFVLRDISGRQVYAWTLNAVSRKALGAGASTSFLTRLASPPKVADEIQIRFALKGEMGSNDAHANIQH